MEPLRILVLSSPVTDALDGDGKGGRVCRERFPDMDWQFRSFTDCTEADVLAADVITGHPRPQWLKNASKLRWLHLQSAGVNGYERREIYAREDVIVTRAAGVHAPAMAEHALGMALSLTRRLALVWLAYPIAEVVSLILSVVFLRKTMERMRRTFGA